jgi:hypothetical protein
MPGSTAATRGRSGSRWATVPRWRSSPCW